MPTPTGPWRITDSSGGDEAQPGEVAEDPGRNVGVIAEVEVLDRTGGFEVGLAAVAPGGGVGPAGVLVSAEHLEELGWPSAPAAAWASRA